MHIGGIIVNSKGKNKVNQNNGKDDKIVIKQSHAATFIFQKPTYKACHSLAQCR